MLIDAFWSDPHFCHTNIIEYASRPFFNAEDMNKALISRYNSVVGPNDVCVCLGDVFLGKIEQVRPMIAALNGRKILVMGNHDKSAGTMLDLGFDMVVRNMTIMLAGKVCHLHHNPRPAVITETNKVLPLKQHGEVLLHGHTHERSKGTKEVIHVGVDAWNYYPVRREELENIILGKTV